MHPPTHPTFLSDDDVARELCTARGEVDRLLAAVREFAVIAHDSPWLHLDDLLRELHAAAITVAVLEGVQARTY